MFSVGGQDAFDDLVANGWKFEKCPLLKPLTAEEIVERVMRQRVRATEIFEERKAKIRVKQQDGKIVETYAIKVTEIATCDCAYCSSVT